MGKLKRHGQTVPVVVFTCRNCQRRLVCTRDEAKPPNPGQVPYCGDCLAAGLLVQMTRREYRSGPPDLIV